MGNQALFYQSNQIYGFSCLNSDNLIFFFNFKHCLGTQLYNSVETDLNNWSNGSSVQWIMAIHVEWYIMQYNHTTTVYIVFSMMGLLV